jgi:hypothetical protein
MRIESVVWSFGLVSTYLALAANFGLFLHNSRRKRELNFIIDELQEAKQIYDAATRELKEYSHVQNK